MRFLGLRRVEGGTPRPKPGIRDVTRPERTVAVKCKYFAYLCISLHLNLSDACCRFNSPFWLNQGSSSQAIKSFGYRPRHPIPQSQAAFAHGASNKPPKTHRTLNSCDDPDGPSLQGFGMCVSINPAHLPPIQNDTDMI